MSNIVDKLRACREMKKERRERNLAGANSDGWHKHNEYRWSFTLNGKRLDYWPSRNKWQYNDRVMVGDVTKFIAKRVKQ